MAATPGARFPGASVFPITAEIDIAGRLQIGGCDVDALADAYGTPLYLYDEATIREVCAQYRGSFESRLQTRVLYAGKAYLSPALVGVLVEEGLGVDVVSGGELFVALRGGMNPATIGLHGNNKAPDELRQALEAGVGRIIVDNDDELTLLAEMTAGRPTPQRIMLRVTPGVDAHTHEKTSTGLKDSKFGFPLASGAAAQAVERALSAPGLDLTGFHIHLGSPIFELAPYEAGIEVMASFAAEMRDRHGYVWREFSPGGGFALAYTSDNLPPAVEAYAETISTALKTACAERDLPLPEVHIEPGRSVVGRAGVAVYTVGSRKEIPGVRTYVSVDGGMADNVRPAMYGSKYEVFAVTRMREPARETVTLAGKFCESGDVLVRDARLPALRAGDRVAIPASGAYQIAMESNYNLALRPPVLFLQDGEARLVRRRQTFEDLLQQDMTE